MKTYEASAYPYKGHRASTGGETVRTWTARGGIECRAERGASGMWRMTDGPERLIGRERRNIKALIEAANA